MESVKPLLFSLGKIVSTPGALDALARANQQPHDFLNRHADGDWGSDLVAGVAPILAQEPQRLGPLWE